VIVELVGLNGTGKSSVLTRLLDSNKYLNYHEVVKISWLNYAGFIIINIISIIDLILRRKKIRFIRIYVNFFCSLLFLEKHLYNMNHYIMADQGLVFQLTVLSEEGLILNKDVRRLSRRLNAIEIKVVYFNADVAVLYQRVKNRDKSDGRGQFMTKGEFHSFCMSYIQRFDTILQQLVLVKEVNANGSIEDMLYQIENI
jgi:shikimate kinase